MTTWFTSDWHLGHARINELAGRPFASVDEMNEELIRRHNDVVEPSDTVWVLGDVCMGPIDESLALVQRFNGRKLLVAGNHDRCFVGYGDNVVNTVQHDAWVRRYRDAGFEVVVTGRSIRRFGVGVIVPLRLADGTYARGVELCHFPTSGDTQDVDRFADYRPRDRVARFADRWTVCGHVHERWTVRERNVNVGVDRWNFYPVLGADVAELIERVEIDRLTGGNDDLEVG